MYCEKCGKMVPDEKTRAIGAFKGRIRSGSEEYFCKVFQEGKKRKSDSHSNLVTTLNHNVYGSRQEVQLEI